MDMAMKYCLNVVRLIYLGRDRTKGVHHNGHGHEILFERRALDMFRYIFQHGSVHITIRDPQRERGSSV